MKLSVVIPSYCAEANLNSALASIGKQIDSEVECIVVDCSPHNKVEDICNRYPFVTFIKSEQRFDPGQGRNIGAKASTGETLVFIDADVVLHHDAIKNIKKAVEQGYRAFGAALDLNTEVHDSFPARVEHYYFNHESQSTRSFTLRKNLSSAFMIIEKALFLQFGGFSDIPRMQDTELTERLVASGIELFLVPSVIGYQIQDSPLEKVLRKIAITGNNTYFIRYQNSSGLRKRGLFALLAPLMMLAKISRINYRNLRYSFSLKMLLVYSPYMYICGLYWMKGFYRALVTNSGISSGR
ncbi:glycosyltransferase [Vibrio sp. JC009]|uniref:glycosyltransferase n=1 Tax=Vibrio sp. JC009 TaxID=2912314 RepID=UPI0023AE9B81|nr:glycosyltransferase [Vibrio sp. JC009]WED20616.1 glycosyltransferase [Vibrio sp. JC009]